MQAAKRKRTRYAEPSFLMDESNVQQWLCEQGGEPFAYFNFDAFTAFLWGLWLFACEEYPAPYYEDLTIWHHDGPPKVAEGKPYSICEVVLVEDSFANADGYENDVVMGSGRIDFAATRQEFRQAFLDAKTIGRRRAGKTVDRVKLFQKLWVVRVAEEYWPPKKPKKSVID